MLVSGIFGRRNIYGLDAEISFPEEVFARTEALAEVKVRNRRKWMPAFRISVEAAGGGCFFPFIAANSTASGFSRVIFEKRGVSVVDGALISSNFPFNFFERFRKIRKEAPVTVYPKPIPCALPAFHDRGTRHRGDKELNKPGYEADILSIREYVPGDPLKYISWKATAKTGSLKTRELSAIERQRVTIDFDGMEKSDVERALSCTAHAVLGLMRSGIPVGLRIGGETLKPGLSTAHRRSLLTRLALYGQN
ncbi:MAG: DUF58 domain-containing protein [Syntrophobacteraceae bacterium]